MAAYFQQSADIHRPSCESSSTLAWTPRPRAVLERLAYTVLVPVIDGGIAVDVLGDGRMRSASWRAHAHPRPALHTLLEAARLDDPIYIAGTGRTLSSPQNVVTLSASVSAAVLAQIVSLAAHPGGQGVPAPLRYTLATHTLE